MIINNFRQIVRESSKLRDAVQVCDWIALTALNAITVPFMVIGLLLLVPWIDRVMDGISVTGDIHQFVALMGTLTVADLNRLPSVLWPLAASIPVLVIILRVLSSKAMISFTERVLGNRVSKIMSMVFSGCNDVYGITAWATILFLPIFVCVATVQDHQQIANLESKKTARATIIMQGWKTVVSGSANVQFDPTSGRYTIQFAK